MRALVTVVVLSATLTLSGCGAGPPDHVVLGLVAPVSGDRAYLGREVELGVRAAVDDLNRGGGLLGRPVELTVRDDAELVDLPRQLADLAERQRVSAIIGPEAPAVLLGERNPLSRRDVPAVLATAFAGDLDRAASLVVRTVPSAQDQGRALGRWLRDVRGITAAAVLVADPVEATLVVEALRTGLTAADVDVAAHVEADPGAPDLGPALAALRDRAPGAGALLIWAPPVVAARATRAARPAGWGETQIAVPASSFVGEYRTLAEEASEGVVLPFPFRESWFGPEMEAWMLRWYRDHGLGALPDLDTLVLDLPVAALAAYDAVGVVAEAVRIAGSRAPAAVSEALPTVTHDGLLRTYRFPGREAWSPDDLHVARFHHLAVVFDVDPRLDTERQRRFYDQQVNLRFVPEALREGPAGALIDRLVEEGRTRAPAYEAPLPPPGPVGRPG